MPTKPSHPGYESANMGQAFILMGLILVVAAALLFVALDGTLAAPTIKGYPVDTSSFKEPVLQYDPVADLATYQAQQAELLNSYGWKDKADGVAHIPIDRAIDLISEQGLPVRESAQ
jgi:hypothetical protein